MSQLTALDALSEGVTIPLADGSTPAVRYSLRSLALLEARFGSVAAVQEAIDVTGRGAAFGPVIDVLGAGLVGAGGFEPHVRQHQDAKGNISVSSITYYRVRDRVELGTLLDPQHIREYGQALNLALSAAFGSQGNGSAAEGPLPEMDVIPGPTTSTSESLSATSLPPTFLP